MDRDMGACRAAQSIGMNNLYSFRKGDQEGEVAWNAA